ncbi:MAG: hypothetical protein ACO4CZ_09205 [Planctomycetota bacterium]
MDLHNTRSLLTAIGLAVCSLQAQSVEPGYRTASVIPLPPGTGQVTVLDGDAGVVWFDGTRLVLRDASGAQRELLSFGSPVFGSFSLQVGPTEVLFGESSNGDLWLVSTVPNGRAPRLLANLPANFDATQMDADAVLVSAKTGGYTTPDNDIVHVDLVTGGTQLVARVDGASGPLTWTRNGLYYATSSLSFPPPPGAVEVLLCPPLQIRKSLGNRVLTAADAIQVATGIDSAWGLAVDSDFDLIVSDWLNGAVHEVSIGFRAGRNEVVRRSDLIDYDPAAPQPLGIRWRAGPPWSGQFEPFQPSDAGALIVHESTFGGASQIRRLVPARPVTSAPMNAPAGPFDVVTTGGPALGTGLVAVGPNPRQNEGPYPVPGFEQMILWDPTMFFAWDVLAVSFDASGTATLPLFNPGIGGSGSQIGMQCAFVDAQGQVIGSAAPITVGLR